MGQSQNTSEEPDRADHMVHWDVTARQKDEPMSASSFLVTIRDVSNCVWLLPNPLPMESTGSLLFGTMQNCTGVVFFPCCRDISYCARNCVFLSRHVVALRNPMCPSHPALLANFPTPILANFSSGQFSQFAFCCLPILVTTQMEV